MTHILADRDFPKNFKERVERSNHKYFQGLNELQGRRRHGGITPEEFESIRSFSRQSWTSECNEQDPIKSSFHTTYSSFHHRKKESPSVELQYKPKSRPSSPTRKNNPHPRRAFLTLHLKDAPGFEPQQIKHGQIPYKVGKVYEKDNIYTNKKLYYSTPNFDQSELKILRKTLPTTQIPVTQAWLKEASDKERQVVLDMLKSCTGFTTTNQDMSHSVKPTATVSMHRWLRKAGVEEQETIARLPRSTLNSSFNTAANAKYIGNLDPNRYLLGKYEDLPNL